jgi:hypothetical protein
MDNVVGDITVRLSGFMACSDSDGRKARSVADYVGQVREETWTEASTEGTGPVTGKLWTRAIQAAVDENQTIFIPDRGEPYYIDAPIVLKSGRHLIADETAEIRLKPGTNTCMVRNERPVCGQEGPVNPDNDPDTDITIEGGIWTTLCVNPESNGNFLGGPDPANPASWVEVFSPDKDCTVKNLQLSDIVKQGTAEGKAVTSPVKAAECVEIVVQKPNPDYPRTTPRGGTGKGVLILKTER